MIWTRARCEFYVDDPTIPSNVYATFTPSTQPGTWPFDDGPQFSLLNLAVGGNWPGNPDATTVFPADMQVDYVRIYTQLIRSLASKPNTEWARQPLCCRD